MFGVTVDQLQALFDQDHIREGRSMESLKKMGKIQGLFKTLNTSLREGRNESEEQSQKKIQAFGDNQPIVKESKTLWKMIVESFEDEMLRILCIAAVVSLVLGIATEGLEHGWMEGTSILVAVVIIVTVTSGNNWVKEQQFKKLNAEASKKNVNVLRNGDWVNMSVYDMLVGDIQQIETGEILSVDGVLVEGHDLVADESAMTGETHGIKKKVPQEYSKEEASPFLVSGSKIVEGTGTLLVLAVGVHSQYGKLKLILQAEEEQTPLQQKLEILANQIGVVGMYAAAATFIAMCLHIIHDAWVSGTFFAHLFRLETLLHLVDAFIVAVSIIVVAVPEGLPLAVTIALAYSVGKMKDENNLVRYLQACETMGGADNICSDKTGTLTKNIMSVVRVFSHEKEYTEFEKGTFNEEFTKLLCKGICLNSNATPEFIKEGDSFRVNQIGNKTECALLELSYKMGYSYKEHRKADDLVKVFPFSSSKKNMKTIAKVDGKNITFLKGAPDFNIPQCVSYIGANGEKKPVDDKFKKLIEEKIEVFAKLTLRTLLLAYKEGGDANQDIEQASGNFIILGMVGIKDPLRPEIPHAVAQCHTAGVRVRMITGDNELTAVAIAKEAGILEESWQDSKDDLTVMTGKQFREYVGGLVNAGKANESVKDMERFKRVAKELKVLARSSPDDKYLMATGLKKLHHVVAMTGDGTNDAPALKKADIGFAMGITGTEVAKEAAGIILLDDNFNSIVTAMKWGRNIFDSIRKFLQFQLTVNFTALALAFMGAAVLKESPLNPIQMLWVNLIMDTLAALALATEPPSDELLKRKPYSRFEGLITADMWRNVLTQGVLQVIILSIILFRGPQIFNIPSSIGLSHDEWNNETGKHYSIFFNVFVLLQVFNEINARKLKSTQLNVFENFFNNTLFLTIMVATLIIQYLCVEFGGQSLKTVPLSFSEHLICAGLGSLSIFAGLIFKIAIPASLFKFLEKEEDPEEQNQQQEKDD